MHARSQDRHLLAAPRAPRGAGLHGIALGIVLLAAPEGAAAADARPQNALPLAVSAPGIQGQQTFQQPDELQWFKIKLEKGVDYALYSAFYSENLSYFPPVSVHNSNGRRLARFSMSSGLDGWYDGIEFRAPYSGTFYIRTKNIGPDFPTSIRPGSGAGLPGRRDDDMQAGGRPDAEWHLQLLRGR